MINRIVAGLETADRWGVKEGQSLASKIINSQAINRIVRQYIDDEISSSDAIAKMNAELSSIERQICGQLLCWLPADVLMVPQEICHLPPSDFNGKLARREKRLAFLFLFPTIILPL